jgi:hypothetical protein
LSQPEDKRTRQRRLRHETEDLHKAILAVTLAWAKLEDEMAHLLSQLISPRKYDAMGYYIYFSPDNSATRFDIVAAAYRHNTDDLVDDAVRTRAIEEWDAFSSVLHGLRRARNDVTHGVVREIEVGRSNRPVTRLTPSAFDPHRTKARRGQMHGRSAADVEIIAENLREVWLWAREFRELALTYHLDAATLPKRLGELARHRRSYVDRTAVAPTPPKQ